MPSNPLCRRAPCLLALPARSRATRASRALGQNHHPNRSANWLSLRDPIEYHSPKSWTFPNHPQAKFDCRKTSHQKRNRYPLLPQATGLTLATSSLLGLGKGSFQEFSDKSQVRISNTREIRQTATCAVILVHLAPQLLKKVRGYTSPTWQPRSRSECTLKSTKALLALKYSKPSFLLACACGTDLNSANKRSADFTTNSPSRSP